MRDLGNALERRRSNRKRRSLPCYVRVDGRLHSGEVENVSARGLFVRTDAQAIVGERVSVEIPSAALEFEALVRHLRRLPHSLRSLGSGGFGMSIASAAIRQAPAKAGARSEPKASGVHRAGQAPAKAGARSEPKASGVQGASFALASPSA